MRVFITNETGKNLFYKNSKVKAMHKERKKGKAQRTEIKDVDLGAFKRDHEAMLENETYKNDVDEGRLTVEFVEEKQAPNPGSNGGAKRDEAFIKFLAESNIDLAIHEDLVEISREDLEETYKKATGEEAGKKHDLTLKKDIVKARG